MDAFADVDLSRVVGPMIAQSDAPFRALCLKYGASCAYSEMLFSNRIVNEPQYLDAYIPSCDKILMEDTCAKSGSGLVVQICGNEPSTLASAVSKIAESGRASAIDLNLGCPQDRAKEDLFGSFLLDKCHWKRVFDCVQAMSDALKPFNMPLFCKIRLIEGADSIELTKEFCRGLISSGCKLITIHGRTRGSTRHRRSGPANLAAISDIASTLHDTNVPFVSNGNIRCAHEVEAALSAAQPCIGVMSAEGVLRSPALFMTHLHLQNEGAVETAASGSVPAMSAQADDFFNCTACSSINRCASIPDLFSLFEEYCALSERYREMGGWGGMDSYELAKREESKQIYIARQHLVWMLGKAGHGRTVRFKHLGTSYKRQCDLLTDLNNAFSMNDLLIIARKCLMGCWS